MKIFLKPELIKANLSSQAIAVSCALRYSFCDNENPIIYTSVDYWAFALTGSINYSTRFKEALLFGFNELVENGYVKIIKKKKDSYILDYSPMIINPSDDKYVLIDPQDVRTIFNLEGVKIFQLLKYFVVLSSTMTVSLGMPTDRYCERPVLVSNLAGTYLAKLSDISYQTILSYNRILEESNIIYVFRQRVRSVTKEGTPYTTPNIYGKYADKDWIDVKAPKFLNKKRHNDVYTYKNSGDI